MNDLISRRGLFNELFVYNGKICPDTDVDNFPITFNVKTIKDAIRNAPTAYDVDKVVKELEKCRKIMESPIIENCFEKECDCSDCTVCCFNKAKEIVKSGLNTGTED